MIFVEQHDMGPVRRHPTDLIHPLNYLDFKLRTDKSPAAGAGPSSSHRGSEKHLWTQAKDGQRTASATAPRPSMGPHMQEGPRPRSPSPRGETTSTRCLVGLRFQGKQAELPARKGGSPLPSPETGQQPRPPGRAGVLPSCSSGGCRERGAPLPQPSPSPTACRWACQLLSKRQSSVTRGQAFLSFWNNFQTLNSMAYIKKKDQSSKSHCAGTKTWRPLRPPCSPAPVLGFLPARLCCPRTPAPARCPAQPPAGLQKGR